MGRVREFTSVWTLLPESERAMAGLDSGFGAIGVFVVTPSFTRTLRPNQTHLGRYTRTVSLPPGVASLP